MLSFPEHESKPLLETTVPKSYVWNKIVRKTVLNGIGMFSDGFVTFVISFGLLSTASQKHHQSAAQVLTFVGHAASIISPFIFGPWGDHYGRKNPFTSTLSMIAIGAIVSVLTLDSSASSFLFGLFALAQILIGIGAGGEYPLAVSITAETFSITRRGKIMVCVLCFSVLGQISGSLASYLSILPTGSDFKTSWRWILAAGILPGIIAGYLRSRRGETRRWIIHAEGSHRISWRRFVGKRFIGVAIPAFVLGMLHAVHTLLLMFLLDKVFKDDPSGEMIMEKDLATYFLAEIALALAVLPGYLAAYFAVDSSRFGRRGSQVICFLLLTLIYLTTGLGLKYIVNSDDLFLVFLVLSMFLVGAGPAVNCYLIPAESFPTSIRARVIGLVTASRNVGRLVASGGLLRLLSITTLSDSSMTLFICGAGCSVGGLVTIFFTVETREHSLDNLEIKISKMIESSIPSFGEFPKQSPSVSPVLQHTSSFVNETNQEYLEDSEDEDM